MLAARASAASRSTARARSALDARRSTGRSSAAASRGSAAPNIEVSHSSVHDSDSGGRLGLAGIMQLLPLAAQTGGTLIVAQSLRDREKVTEVDHHLAIGPRASMYAQRPPVISGRGIPVPETSLDHRPVADLHSLPGQVTDAPHFLKRPAVGRLGA